MTMNEGLLLLMPFFTKMKLLLLLLLVLLPRSISGLSQSSRRRLIFRGIFAPVTGFAINLPSSQAADTSKLDPLLADVEAARKQLDAIPALLRESKWDSVRAILITPPLSDCWTKSSRKLPLLPSFAEAIGDAGGDELAALEAKEEAISHLRYLDMAAYNNVFNPIATEGETGASKALIRSYYEDPVNEYKASVEALDALVRIAKEANQ